MHRTQAPNGISFIEIALISVLLGGCAMTLGPELLHAAHSAHTRAVEQDLAMFRRQIQQYQLEHDGRLPGAGTDSEAMFLGQLMHATNERGEWAAGGHLGPYLLGPIPSNPFSGEDGILVVPGQLTPEHADDCCGWIFSSTTGEFRAQMAAGKSRDWLTFRKPSH